MLNKKATLVACALIVAGGVSFAAVQQGRRPVDGRQQDPALESKGDHAGRPGRLGRWMHRRQLGRKLVRSLEITEPQKEQARGVARSLRPLVDEVRPRVRDLMTQARELARSGNREAARELLRSELRPILEDAMARARPQVAPLVGTLSPEQRAKLEARAAARGKTFDEERFTRRLTWMLARRGAGR